MSLRFYLNQNFDRLKAECLRLNKLYEDDKFPANRISISKNLNDSDLIEWKRPKELFENPKFCRSELKPNDIYQGEIGNCWVISAIAALSTNKDLLNFIVPKEQSFDKDYAGIFRFRFWLYGEWVEVVVDDKLPSKNNNLIFSRCSNFSNEMLGPLLEKAYAKLNKCYSNLISGEIADSLTDLTGGIHENFNLKDVLENKGEQSLWERIFELFEMKSMAGCSIDLPKDETEPLILENKLRTGHTYTVLAAFEFETYNNNIQNLRFRNSSKEKLNYSQSIKLLKLRNPWGLEISWTGKWSLDSVEWIKFSESIKEHLEFSDNQKDGVFFISFEDFLQFFDNIDFVHINLDAFCPKKTEFNFDSFTEYYYKQVTGAWKIGLNSGGSHNSGEKIFWTNPHYLLDLSESNLECKHFSVIMSLVQTDTLPIREKIGKCKGSREALGIAIYKIKNKEEIFINKSRIKTVRTSNLEFFENTGVYLYKRHISKRFDLSSGAYVVIPSCYKKDVNMKYLLRIFIEGEKDNFDLDLKIVNSTKSQTDIDRDYLRKYLPLEENTFFEIKHDTNDFKQVQTKTIKNISNQKTTKNKKNILEEAYEKNQEIAKRFNSDNDGSQACFVM